MLSPIIFFSTVVAFISSLQTFDLVFVLVKNAGPDNGTRTIVYHIYDLGFAKSQFGLSSAASIVLLVLTLVITARQFISSVPVELEEAAMIDGASRWRIYWTIILPAIRPGLGALAIIVALDAWNNFLLPLVLLNSTELFTVPLLLSQFQGQYGGMNYGLVMAATALSTVPMLIAFVIGQRQIIESLATSGLGGR